jgi:hypothetical protein
VAKTKNFPSAGVLINLTAMNTPPSFHRRDFLKHSALTGASLLAPAFAPLASAAPSRESKSETLVAQLHKSLTEPQRSALCFPWEHELRLKVDNNWHITPTRIDKILDKDQQDLVRQIFDGLHSDEYKK